MFVENRMEGFVLGHEFAGHGPNGAAYAVEPTVWCGHCAQCITGQVHRCLDPGAGNLGIFRDGGMSRVVHVPEQMLLPLPAGLDARDACLVEPAAVAWHGVSRAAVQPHERVVVVGGGSIGLLAVAAARSRGLRVDAVVRHEAQRAAADALGAGRAHGDYDVVIDAAGSESALARCAELARPEGRVVLLGVYLGTVPLPAEASLTKELTYANAMAYGRANGAHDFADAARMLAADPLIAGTIITHRFPLAEAAEAFRTAADRASGAIKVVLHP